MKVVLFGEGNTDVTVGSKDHEGAIGVLLRKILEAAGNADVTVIGARLPSLHKMRKTSGYSQKVEGAIAFANLNRADAVAIVVDRDGDKERFGMLQDGRDAARNRVGEPYAALALRTALGIAVEMLEAWLIADTRALASLFDVSGAMPDPEKIANPKERLNELLDEAGLEVTEAYDMIASEADLDVIQRRCPAFADFVREVRAELLKAK